MRFRRAPGLIAGVLTALAAGPSPAAAQGGAPAPAPAARPEPPEQPAPPRAARRPGQPFWEWVLRPHDREIAAAREKASHLLERATRYADPRVADMPHAMRAGMLAEAYGMLRYAHRLSPDHLEIRRLFGYVAAEMGRVDEAVPLLEGYLRDRDPGEEPPPGVYLRLGRLHAATGRIDDAIDALGRAAASDGIMPEAEQALVELSVLLMHDGQTTRAIALLEDATRDAGAPGATLGHGGVMLGGPGGLLALLALAVAYDKDEQVTRAYQALERLVGVPMMAIRGDLVDALWEGIGGLELTPPVERHYLQALLFEATGRLHAARAEWRAYARGGDAARFDARARAHARDVEALLRARAPAPRPPP